MSIDLEAKISDKYWLRKIINENNGARLNKKVSEMWQGHFQHAHIQKIPHSVSCGGFQQRKGRGTCCTIPSN